jgi:tRNA nucleotidyltransferase (CCA-adding enzyme)
VLLACECDARGRLGLEESPYPQRDRLLAALTAARTVDTAAVAEQARCEGHAGDAIGERIQRARIHAVEQLQTNSASAA